MHIDIKVMDKRACYKLRHDNVGALIEQLRKSRDKGRDQLANAMGTMSANIEKLEDGFSTPTLHTINRLLDELDYDLLVCSKNAANTGDADHVWIMGEEVTVVPASEFVMTEDYHHIGYKVLENEVIRLVEPKEPEDQDVVDFMLKRLYETYVGEPAQKQTKVGFLRGLSRKLKELTK